MSRLSIQFSKTFLACFGLGLLSVSQFYPLHVAEAGVLLRSGKVRSNVRTRAPRIRLGFRPASTWVSVSRRNNPINTATLNSERALDRYERSLDRYAREVKRFERRQERKQKREARRRERERKRELQKQKREYARKLAEYKRKQALKAPLIERQGADSEDVELGSDTAKVRIKGQGGNERSSFWSRFWQKLIGRK